MNSNSNKYTKSKVKYFMKHFCNYYLKYLRLCGLIYMYRYQTKLIKPTVGKKNIFTFTSCRYAVNVCK